MPELPTDVADEIGRLSEEGDALAEDEDWDGAIERFEEALTLLPESPEPWGEAFWLLTSIGDMHFHRGDFAAGAEALNRVLREHGGTDNPFVGLRLGQCLYELGDERGGANWMTGAMMLAGPELFADEDPRYWAFLKTVLRPPPGGWPDGM